MVHIEIICVGKIKEKYLKDAILEYTKRLSKYCVLTITELDDKIVPNNINNTILENIKQSEGKDILSHIKKESYIICLDLKGNEYTSEQFSQKIENIQLNYNSHITFVIGGTLGLSNDVLNRANESISFSKLTFPHQLIRVFLLEQIFRSFKISKNETYHR